MASLRFRLLNSLFILVSFISCASFAASISTRNQNFAEVFGQPAASLFSKKCFELGFLGSRSRVLPSVFEELLPVGDKSVSREFAMRIADPSSFSTANHSRSTLVRRYQQIIKATQADDYQLSGSILVAVIADVERAEAAVISQMQTAEQMNIHDETSKNTAQVDLFKYLMAVRDALVHARDNLNRDPLRRHAFNVQLSAWISRELENLKSTTSWTSFIQQRMENLRRIRNFIYDTDYPEQEARLWLWLWSDRQNRLWQKVMKDERLFLGASLRYPASYYPESRSPRQKSARAFEKW